MRWILLVCVLTGTVSDDRPASDLRTIDELNAIMQERFRTPPAVIPFNFLNDPGLRQKLSGLPITSHPPLGMSRVVQPGSFGSHYLPAFNTTRDFRPESKEETEVTCALESLHEQVGFYLIGRDILTSKAEAPNFRALKGPAALTAGTPRPAWYPTGVNKAASPDALPDWKAIYPLAQKAMKSFRDGGTGFETTIGSWRVAARPVIASQERCLACHSTSINRAVLHEALGGVLYAFRPAGV